MDPDLRAADHGRLRTLLLLTFVLAIAAPAQAAGGGLRCFGHFAARLTPSGGDTSR
jgi:hypothetical protein